MVTYATSAGITDTGPPIGIEIGYAEITSNLTTTNVAQANRVDATGLIVTVSVGARPIVVEFYASVANTTVNDGVGIVLVENVAGNGNNTPILQQTQMISAGIAGANVPIRMPVRLAPTVGAHTYKVMFYATVGGTATIIAAATEPAFLRVVEC